MNKLIAIFALALALALPGIATASTLSDQNQAGYWGESCYKINIYDSPQTYTVTDENATKVIVKGGTTNKVYETGLFSNLTAQINPNNGKPYGISHVIICKDSTIVSSDTSDPTASSDTTEQPNTTTDTEDGTVSEEAAFVAVNSATDKSNLPKTLPNTGAPLLTNLMFGASLSILAGWTVRKRQKSL